MGFRGQEINWKDKKLCEVKRIFAKWLNPIRNLLVDELFIGLDTAVTLVVVVVNCDDIIDEIAVVDVETITDDVDGGDFDVVTEIGFVNVTLLVLVFGLIEVNSFSVLGDKGGITLVVKGQSIVSRQSDAVVLLIGLEASGVEFVEAVDSVVVGAIEEVSSPSKDESTTTIV